MNECIMVWVHTLLWFYGAEITDLNMLMVAVFYVGDCILMKTVRKENDNEK